MALGCMSALGTEHTWEAWALCEPLVGTSVVGTSVGTPWASTSVFAKASSSLLSGNATSKGSAASQGMLMTSPRPGGATGCPPCQTRITRGPELVRMRVARGPGRLVGSIQVWDHHHLDP